MAKLPVAGNNSTCDNLETWTLRVYIHCEGCKKKVFKVLQSIDGVYKTEIDSLQHKAIVTGSVDGNTLVQKLLKSGKHAEVLPESFEARAAADSAPGKSKKKKNKQNKQKEDETTHADNQHADEEKEESEAATTEGNDGAKEQEIAQVGVAAGDCNGGGGGGGGKKKNKKKKGKVDKKDNNAPPNGDTQGLPAGNAPELMAENVGASMEQLNLSRPGVYATPYDLPAYQNYYPTPAYGVSYSTTYPSAESSYYTPPVYGYAQSHPTSVYYPPPLPPPPAYYPRSAFDDHDDENNGQGRGCIIM
ncbi:heavy metal-associated isoprenylated plant protein 36 [Lactuca sativa]|uniref:heavy metal-associated isoprenylated plant protein 36 n=1 Tax=Lactuca sativa TaxID=4236 RepID=UPI000CC93D9C|nr:heavy metal-associated isoprenylated plant protein 36 [Lactuca sativa]